MMTKDKITNKGKSEDVASSKNHLSSIDANSAFPKKMAKVDKIISKYGLPDDMKDWLITE